MQHFNIFGGACHLPFDVHSFAQQAFHFSQEQLLPLQEGFCPK